MKLKESNLKLKTKYETKKNNLRLMQRWAFTIFTIKCHPKYSLPANVIAEQNLPEFRYG